MSLPTRLVSMAALPSKLGNEKPQRRSSIAKRSACNRMSASWTARPVMWRDEARWWLDRDSVDETLPADGRSRGSSRCRNACRNWREDDSATGRGGTPRLNCAFVMKGVGNGCLSRVGEDDVFFEQAVAMRIEPTVKERRCLVVVSRSEHESGVVVCTLN